MTNIMYTNRAKHKTAFTLLEVLVSVSILSIIILCTYQALYSGDRSWRLGSSIITLQENTRNMLYYLTEDIRESRDPLSLTNLTAVGHNFSLSIPDNDTTATVTYRIELASTTPSIKYLSRTSNGISVGVGNYVDTVTFTEVGSTVNITVNTQKQIRPQETETFTLTNRVLRRN